MLCILDLCVCVYERGFISEMWHKHKHLTKKRVIWNNQTGVIFFCDFYSKLIGTCRYIGKCLAAYKTVWRTWITFYLQTTLEIRNVNDIEDLNEKRDSTYFDRRIVWIFNINTNIQFGSNFLWVGHAALKLILLKLFSPASRCCRHPTEPRISTWSLKEVTSFHHSPTVFNLWLFCGVALHE